VLDARTASPRQKGLTPVAHGGLLGAYWLEAAPALVECRRQSWGAANRAVESSGPPRVVLRAPRPNEWTRALPGPLCACLLLFTSPANGGPFSGSRATTVCSGPLGPPSSYGTACNTVRMAVADVDGDGRQDVVAAGNGVLNYEVICEGTVSINLGAAGGSLRTPIVISSPDKPYAVLVGDVNADGVKDVVVTGSWAVAVHLGLSVPAGCEPRFAAPVLYYVPSLTPVFVALVDLTRDGIRDILTVNNGGAGAGVSILPGNGSAGVANGTFNSTTNAIAVGTAPVAAAVGDYNRDGIPDVAVSVHGANSIAVLLGSIGGGLGGPVLYATGAGPYDVKAADLDRDLDLDLIVANQGASTISVLYGTGTGQFSAPQSFPTGSAPTLIELADFDGNGILDVAVLSSAESGARLMLAGGVAGVWDGTFASTSVYTISGYPLALAQGDLNQDGHADLVIGQAYDEAYYRGVGHNSRAVVFLGDCAEAPPPPPAPPAPLVGAWTPQGIALCAAPGRQAYPVSVPDGAAGAIVAWQDFRTAISDIYAQRVGPVGDVQWSPDGARVSTSPGAKGPPRVVSDGATGALIAWAESGLVYLQHIGPDGQPRPGWPAEGRPVMQGPGFLANEWHLVSDGAGGALVAWIGVGGEPAVNGAFAQRITAEGNVAAGWPPRGVTAINTNASISRSASVSDGQGGVIIYLRYFFTNCPSHDCVTLEGLERRRVTFQAAVDPAWGGGLGNVDYHLAAADPSGRHLLVYSKNFQEFGSIYVWPVADLHSTLYLPTGTQAWNAPLTLASGWQQGVSLAAADDGGILFAWNDTRDFAYSWEIYGVKLAPDGTVACGWNAGGIPICTSPGNQLGARIVSDGAGGGFFCWYDERNGQSDVYGVRMTAEGAVHPDWTAQGNPICNAPGEQDIISLVPSAPFGAIAVWQDERTGEADIYAQRITFDTPTPVQLSLVSAVGEPGHARLVWHSSDGVYVTATVFRREEATAWAALGNIASEASGRIAFEDATVTSGRRYGYRLGVRDEAGEEYAGEVWVDIPAAYVLALTRLPTPTARELVVEFSLPVPAPAVLRLFDVAGRVVASREVGSLGPGHHAVKLGSLRVSSGIYFVRLTQGMQSLSARICIVR
jgi:hypothetical protein